MSKDFIAAIVIEPSHQTKEEQYKDEVKDNLNQIEEIISSIHSENEEDGIFPFTVKEKTSLLKLLIKRLQDEIDSLKGKK